MAVFRVNIKKGKILEKAKLVLKCLCMDNSGLRMTQKGSKNWKMSESKIGL